MALRAGVWHCWEPHQLPMRDPALSTVPSSAETPRDLAGVNTRIAGVSPQSGTAGDCGERLPMENRFNRKQCHTDREPPGYFRTRLPL